MDTPEYKIVGPKTKFNVKAAPIETYDAPALYALKFQDAAKVITRMDTMQKALVSSQAQEYIDSLYSHANRFGNVDYPLDEQPSAAQFRGIMGKIKHWETIMYWLLEIDVMMEAAELERLAEEAERELDEYLHDIRMISAKGVKQRSDIIKKAENTKANTDEIMSLAAELAGKYFG